jgi:hypothetical protein
LRRLAGEQLDAFKAEMARIEAFAPLRIQQQEPAYALGAARAAEPVDLGGDVAADEILALGQVVAISADDYATEQITGAIVKLTPSEIAIASRNAQVGEIAIHFPKLGFRIAPVTSVA